MEKIEIQPLSLLFGGLFVGMIALMMGMSRPDYSPQIQPATAKFIPKPVPFFDTFFPEPEDIVNLAANLSMNFISKDTFFPIYTVPTGKTFIVTSFIVGINGNTTNLASTLCKRDPATMVETLLADQRATKIDSNPKPINTLGPVGLVIESGSELGIKSVTASFKELDYTIVGYLRDN